MKHNLVELRTMAVVGPRDPVLPEAAPFVPMDAVKVGIRHPVYTESRGRRGGVRARANDVLFARITPCLENGKVAQLPADSQPTGGSTEFLVVRPGPELDPGFLYYWSLSPRIRDLAQAKMTGTTGRMRLGGKDLATFPIPRFDLAEQRRIVEILEDHLSRLETADSYESIARRRAGALRRSALDRYFAKAQELVALGDVVESVSAGKSFGSSNAPAREGEWGIIKVSAMTWGEFNPDENKAVPAERVDPRFEIRSGDLLVSRANTHEYVGASVLVREVRPRLLLSDKSLRVTPREGVLTEWLWRALQAPSARRQISSLATGTKDSMRNISQASLLRVRVPSVTHAEQTAVVTAYSEVEDAIQRLERLIDASSRRAESLRRGVLATAFEGKLTGRHTDAEVIEEVAQ